MCYLRYLHHFRNYYLILTHRFSLKDYKRQLTAPLETAEISCVSFIGVSAPSSFTHKKCFPPTSDRLQIDALLQLLQRTCQATGVVPVKVSRLSTERH